MADTEDMKKDARQMFHITFKDNDMAAFLTLEKPTEDNMYDANDVLNYINSLGIIEGLQSGKVAAMLKKHIYGRAEIIAEGVPPVDGVDGYFEFFIPVGKEKDKKPEIREDGSVDYTSVNVIHCVSAGDDLAVYHPAVNGTPGVNVRGKTINCKKAKELKPFFCAGCSYDPETFKYTALMDGRVEVSKAKISVLDMQEYRKDIDNVFGDINFKGDVIIHGHVKPGVQIRATKSVTIDKTLEGASITAGGDIIIKGGVMGGNTTRIHCDGDFMADFIEYADVWCGGSVSANIIWGCKVFAKGSVHATGKTGAIISGNVYGMCGVDTIFAGNDAGVKTVISSGVRDSIRKTLDVCEKKLEKLTEEIDELDDEIGELEYKMRLGSDDEFTQKELMRFRRDKIQKAADKKQTEDKRAEIADLIPAAEGAEIIINDKAYPGCYFLIGEEQIVLETERRHAKFVVDRAGNMLLKNLT
ncbi:MAG: FapA family protein [Lachnospiraceae bacterium]|nr:FapA family protein [Lachnospiraceae bacterium]